MLSTSIFATCGRKWTTPTVLSSFTLFVVSDTPCARRLSDEHAFPPLSHEHVAWRAPCFRVAALRRDGVFRGEAPPHETAPPESDRTSTNDRRRSPQQR